jgi:arylsulfatase A-like enzyme
MIWVVFPLKHVCKHPPTLHNTSQPCSINGNPVARTPHVDTLFQEGMSFSTAYAPASVCTPSRAGLLTGRCV